jgi:hypothetical protein
MILVLLSKNPKFIDDEMAQKIAQKLPTIVANALDTSAEEDEAGRLTPEDVRVYVQNSSELDVNTKPFEIIIWAGYSKERGRNTDQRRVKIADRIRFFKPYGVKGSIQIFLNYESYGEV